jgi:hypothetical protein
MLLSISTAATGSLSVHYIFTVDMPPFLKLINIMVHLIVDSAE